MKIFKWTLVPVILLLVAAFILNACGAVRNMHAAPVPWKGNYSGVFKTPPVNPAKKNVFIVGDSKLTVLFDMIAPYFLFSATGQANVFIISKDQTPILVKKGLFVVPHITFGQADSMHLQADLIIIPALSNRGTVQDPALINWIRKNHLSVTKILAVCDGASTAAATGLYDGHLITCHASDYDALRKSFPKASWVHDVSVTKSGNLFSTAGVSNAVEGSLTVIQEMFGEDTRKKVMKDIHYPYEIIKTDHHSSVVNGRDKWSVAKKILFHKNKRIGLLLKDGVNEFDLASIVESYGRTFPSRFIVRNFDRNTTETKYGLTLLTSDNGPIPTLDEWHVLDSHQLTKSDSGVMQQTLIIKYDAAADRYPINTCLARIQRLYGNPFITVVKKSLDYN